MPVVRQHEFVVSEGQTICKHCGVSRERRHEEECDPREVPSASPHSPAAIKSSTPSGEHNSQGNHSTVPQTYLEDTSGNLRILQIPSVESNKEVGSHHFIGVIDASGSMSSYWKDVAHHYNQYLPEAASCTTITFDNRVQECREITLTGNLQNHGGGMTDIFSAFAKMEEIAQNVSEPNLTILFISDGQDNVNGGITSLQGRLQTLRGIPGRNVTFLCLGVEKNFPTFISMQLREMYHNTQSTIPALFLVEYASEKAFFNKFESMKPFLNPVKHRSVRPAVMRMPWEPPVDKAYEGSWVTTNNAHLLIDGTTLQVPDGTVTFQSVQEVFRGYVQELEMLALTKDAQITGKASAAFKYMHKLLDALKEATGVDMESTDIANASSEEWLGFRKRVIRMEVLHRRFWLQTYLKTVEQLAHGQAATLLDEWDAAKRLGMGTFLGKHNQRSLAAKGLGADRFAVMKAEFCSVLEALPIATLPAPPPTLRTMADILLDPDLPSTLPLVSSQFDLVECFPLVGIALRLKRYEGSSDNPWLIQVQSIYQKPDVLNSLSLIKVQGTDRSYRIVIEEEEYNAVLPLFSSKDTALRPLLASDLFHFLMTFNSTLNSDAVLPEATLALLCHSYVYLLGCPASPWRDDMLLRVCESAELICPSYPDMQRQVDALKAGEFDQPSSSPADYQSTLKLMMALQLAQRSGSPAETIVSTLDAIFEAYLTQCMSNGGPQAVLSLDYKVEEVAERVAKAVSKRFEDVYTLGKLNHLVQKVALSILDSNSHGVKLKEHRLVAESLSVGQICAFYGLLHPACEAPSQEQWLRWVHKLHFGSNKLSEQPEMTKITKELRKVIIAPCSTEVVSLALETVKPAFVDWYQSVHQHILPMPLPDLQAHCKANGLKEADFQYYAHSGLIGNACLAPQCPFYLKPAPNFQHHIQVWGPRLPVGFHKLVRQKCHLPPSDIFAIFISGKYDGGRPLVLADLKVTEEEVLNYITKVQEVYAADFPEVANATQ